MNQKKFTETTSLDILHIPKLLTQEGQQWSALSLDCFDTLLWRTVSDPLEVFKDLQNHALYKEHGLNAETRRLAEKKVRQLQWGLNGYSEITIEEIYEHMLPDADVDLHKQLVRIEIETEKKYLFAYLPMFEMLEKAKKMGLKTVLVSDMYIHADQLKELVEACAQKAGIRTNIDYYYTSADHRTTKGRDLFRIVSSELGVPAERMLHVGDNPHADLAGARRAGVKGFHFNRFTPLLEDCMRKNSIMQRLLSDDHGETRPIVSTWHATWSQLPRTNNTMEMVGWYYLGPIMVKYCQWLVEQVQELKNQDHKPRIVFMMRDGYLPFKSFQIFLAQALVPFEVTIHAMDVSRFATMALNFKDARGVQTYLLNQKGKIYRNEMIRQLMGTHDLNTTGIQIDTEETVPWQEFMDSVMRPENLQLIYKASETHCSNFLRYVRKQIKPKAGETLVLADLGYAGTIQDQIKDILSKELDLKVEGRYLILRESTTIQKNKKGLIDYREINNKSLNLLISQIQTLEQLTVNDNGSLVKYADDGCPLHENELLSEQQRQLKKIVQTAALDFVKTQAKSYLKFSKNQYFTFEETAGLIGRFTLQPSMSEIELYQVFCHDINNGTSRMRWISNLPMSRQMLIRGGGITCDSEYHKMLAHDLNAFGPERSHFNFLKTRLGINFTLMDHKVMDGDVPCIIMVNDTYETSKMPCFYTHDGFKVGILKGIKNCTAIGLSFGLKHEWLQMHTVALVDWGQFASNPGWQAQVDLIEKTHAEGGKIMEQGLIYFENSDGYLHVDMKDCNLTSKDNQVMVVIYRDIGARVNSRMENINQHEEIKMNEQNTVMTSQ